MGQERERRHLGPSSFEARFARASGRPGWHGGAWLGQIAAAPAPIRFPHQTRHALNSASSARPILPEGDVDALTDQSGMTYGNAVAGGAIARSGDDRRRRFASAAWIAFL